MLISRGHNHHHDLIINIIYKNSRYGERWWIVKGHQKEVPHSDNPICQLLGGNRVMLHIHHHHHHYHHHNKKTLSPSTSWWQAAWSILSAISNPTFEWNSVCNHKYRNTNTQSQIHEHKCNVKNHLVIKLLQTLQDHHYYDNQHHCNSISLAIKWSSLTLILETWDHPMKLSYHITIGDNNPNNQSDTKQTKGWQIQSLRPPNLALPTQFPMIAQISWVLRGRAGKIRG